MELRGPCRANKPQRGLFSRHYYSKLPGLCRLYESTNFWAQPPAAVTNIPICLVDRAKPPKNERAAPEIRGCSF